MVGDVGITRSPFICSPFESQVDIADKRVAVAGNNKPQPSSNAVSSNPRKQSIPHSIFSSAFDQIAQQQRCCVSEKPAGAFSWLLLPRPPQALALQVRYAVATLASAGCASSASAIAPRGAPCAATTHSTQRASSTPSSVVTAAACRPRLGGGATNPTLPPQSNRRDVHAAPPQPPLLSIA